MIEVSIYWDMHNQLTWRWHDAAEDRHGDWHQLVGERQTRNALAVKARLYLPHELFTSMEVSVPTGMRLVSDTVLRYAAEEQLAKDIESQHIVPLSPPAGGKVPVLVVDSELITRMQATLNQGDFKLVEAFDAGAYSLPECPESSVQVDVGDQVIRCRVGQQLYLVHPSGFSQWFETLLTSTGVDSESLSILLTAPECDEKFRLIKAELELMSASLEARVVAPATLAQIDDRCAKLKYRGNLMTGNHAPDKGEKRVSRWIPSAIAASLALVVWLVASGVSAWQHDRAAEQIWDASESVFKQVFGPQKRIQRPLMVREMENLIDQSALGDSREASVIDVIVALSELNQSLVLKDLRYQAPVGQWFFSAGHTAGQEDRAFALFEEAQTTLMEHGFEVQYSANRDGGQAEGRYQVDVRRAGDR